MAQAALLALVRACSTALQWHITESDVESIEIDLEIWYSFLDNSIGKKVLLKSVYTINNHLLSHIAYMIRSVVSEKLLHEDS
ncbi:hypothetical protein G6F56_011234 [Rhizopus delemar]|nr:hypothetical protein G6F56_011234 [Rhizopus delemar]